MNSESESESESDIYKYMTYTTKSHTQHHTDTHEIHMS